MFSTLPEWSPFGFSRSVFAAHAFHCPFCEEVTDKDGLAEQLSDGQAGPVGGGAELCTLCCAPSQGTGQGLPTSSTPPQRKEISHSEKEEVNLPVFPPSISPSAQGTL